MGTRVVWNPETECFMTTMSDDPDGIPAELMDDFQQGYGSERNLSKTVGHTSLDFMAMELGEPLPSGEASLGVQD